ncbi:Cytochrome P450 family protein [Ceratobasidium theobromae]|uniref:Cytochrome P450 family protein n=1 Tax=Ceratobasidium theobromae TaxID=1582974 RepID=A0A5N5QA54_9AGAM|nr:Cytochrome P450 family protein [Ceratobasidium theobromae]
MGSTLVVLHSAQSANDLLDKCSSIYSDRTGSTMLVDEQLFDWGNGVLITGYGERFRAHRRILNAWLNKNASAAFHATQVFHSRQLLQRTTASAVVSAIYGYEVTSLEDPFVAQIRAAVENISKAILPTNFVVNIMPFLVHVPSWVPGTGWKQTAKEWREHKEKAVEDIYQWTCDQIAKGTAKPSIVQSVLREYEGKELPEEEKDNIKQVAFALFGARLFDNIAGADTTEGSLMAFVIAMLIFPEVQDKAQAEIDQIVGHDRLPEMSDLDQLPYLKNLVQELLRWQPVLPLGVAHTCSQDNTYMGYFIPKGAIVMGNMWAMSRDENLYKNPEVFDPDRFLDPSVPPAPAFGWGRRKCPGSHYAEAMLHISIASILATFRISRAKDLEGKEDIPSTQGAASSSVFL